MTTGTINVAAAQVASIPANKEANLETLRKMCIEAAGKGVELVVFPELTLEGYSAGSRFFDLSENADGPSFQAIAKLATELNIAICYGYAEREGDLVYNSAQLVGPKGESLINHRKTHLYGNYERTWFQKGNEPVSSTRLNGMVVSTLICYEIEFPELARLNARNGSHLILTPTATGAANNPGLTAQMLVRSRAVENHIYVVYANHAAGDENLDLNGHSIVAGPSGATAAYFDSKEQGLICCEINCVEIEKSRAVNPYLDDARLSVVVDG